MNECFPLGLSFYDRDRARSAGAIAQNAIQSAKKRTNQQKCIIVIIYNINDIYVYLLMR